MAQNIVSGYMPFAKMDQDVHFCTYSSGHLKYSYGGFIVHIAITPIPRDTLDSVPLSGGAHPMYNELPLTDGVTAQEFFVF